ncbi:hypothetical protein PHYBLDRAFT_168165 [Phycomyces blakesleeanus NRRL 1555(-)]|uniref:Retrotransposon gag domain-containing protein n=1 Tax=Phycomyces blakesleeanus (strain ATCC 8743b / DSM 1359 / FGSC 10004 / NBRC 33097 / NRRL 1555) TaxID=763407 RepID=A0A163AIK4_PHYB8|nr:hypothetical protein PHYBLDRAFT_168165 [Phycomyces blakesleeanus NRRL 1555(-)]OAD73731.1 hypothetical protein PHYBLDRAFT_168165 [Phycomyces blakesleeanus NRRL 1555(-)]|eukprot:XP_018291771.1 hypothetical protein PHYBLDRAFT_168165 [Phycomyces blakesleeanus NRRL 1555(-)]
MNINTEFNPIISPCRLNNNALSPISDDDLFANLNKHVPLAESTRGLSFASVSRSLAPKKMDTVLSCTEMLEMELVQNLEAFSAAHAINDEQAAEIALNKIKRTKEAILISKECSEILSPSVKVIERDSYTKRLTLNIRDLPKFQLSDDMIRPFPNEEVFQSVDHFLCAFQKTIDLYLLDIEQVWRTIFPLCLPHDYDRWVEMVLKKCVDWKAAKNCFTVRHELRLLISRSVKEVFTMEMQSTESIEDYSKKFLQAVSDADLAKDDAHIADRFLTSLTVQVQTLLRFIINRLDLGGELKRDWTVEQLTQIGRGILGDDNRLHAEATQPIPDKNVHTENIMEKRTDKKMASYSRKKVNHNSVQHRVSKPERSFFCSHHGKNHTHESSECFTLVNRKPKVSISDSCNPCRRCGENYIRGHTTREKTEKGLKRLQDCTGIKLGNILFDFLEIVNLSGLLVKNNYIPIVTHYGSTPLGGTSTSWQMVSRSIHWSFISSQPKNKTVTIFLTPWSEILFNINLAVATWARSVYHVSDIFNLGKTANSTLVEQIFFSIFGATEALSTCLISGKELLTEVLFSDVKICEQVITIGFLYNNKCIVGTPGLPVNKNIVKINLYNIPNCFPETNLQDPLVEALKSHGKAGGIRPATPSITAVAVPAQTSHTSVVTPSPPTPTLPAVNTEEDKLDAYLTDFIATVIVKDAVIDESASLSDIKQTASGNTESN